MARRVAAANVKTCRRRDRRGDQGDRGRRWESLDLFFREARRYALLTAAEEIELAKRVERGDLEAKDTMINANLRLVVSQARRYQGLGCRSRTSCRRACWG